MPNPLFSSQSVLATANALRAMEFNEVTPQNLFERHVRGDWGEMSRSLCGRNEEHALARRGTVMSRFRLDDGELVLVATSFREGRTIISQPGDDDEMERCLAGWQAALGDDVPAVIRSFLVYLPLVLPGA